MSIVSSTRLAGKGLSVEVDAGGAWRLARDGRVLLQAEAVELEVDDRGGPSRLEGECLELIQGAGVDALGSYTSVAAGFRFEPDIDVLRDIRLYEDRGLLVVRVGVCNGSADSPLRLRSIYPVSGTLYLAQAATAVLTNDWERSSESRNLHRLEAVEGWIDSAGNVTLNDADTGIGLAAGALTGAAAFVTFRLAPEGPESVGVAATEDTRSGDKGVLLDPGASLEADGVALAVGHDGYEAAERFADAVRDANGARLRVRRTTGWGDWYWYYGSNSEETVLGNVSAIDARLQGCGIEYIQVDAGWQKVREYVTLPELDMTCTTAAGAPWEPNDFFKHGMKALADEIRRRGYKPGLWIRPFKLSEQAEEFKKPEAWVLAPAVGHPLDAGGSVDISQPEARDWVGSLFERVAREWGYDFIKFDFPTHDLLSVSTFSLPRGVLPSLLIRNERETSAQAFRYALETMRERAGQDTFLLACNCFLGPAVGLVDGFRISDDILHSRWSRNRRMLRACAERYYMDGRLWQNDPDVLHVRDSIPTSQALLWASYLGLAGTMVLLGDAIGELSDERIGVLKKVLPLFEGRAKPLRIFEESPATVWHLPVEKPFERWSVVSLYNWYEDPAETGFQFGDIGLDPARSYHLFDFWAGAYLGEHRGGYRCRLEPTSTRVLAVREALDRPQVLGTNYHVTQGGNELDSVAWDDGAGALTVALRGRPDEGIEVYVHAPKGMRLAKASGMDTLSERPGVAAVCTRLDAQGTACLRLEFEA